MLAGVETGAGCGCEHLADSVHPHNARRRGEDGQERTPHWHFEEDIKGARRRYCVIRVLHGFDVMGWEQLLFHRIKPVFVFDGGTPELKRRTVQHRRVLRERQEHNLKKAAEKILVAQLKQAALTATVRALGRCSSFIAE